LDLLDIVEVRVFEIVAFCGDFDTLAPVDLTAFLAFECVGGLEYILSSISYLLDDFKRLGGELLGRVIRLRLEIAEIGLIDEKKKRS
jgi:hypothetical protein